MGWAKGPAAETAIFESGLAGSARARPPKPPPHPQKEVCRRWSETPQHKAPSPRLPNRPMARRTGKGPVPAALCLTLVAANADVHHCDEHHRGALDYAVERGLSAGLGLGGMA